MIKKVKKTVKFFGNLTVLKHTKSGDFTVLRTFSFVATRLLLLF